MPISRFSVLFLKHRSKEAPNLLRRFGPSKRTQSHNYATSSKHANGRRTSMTPTPTQAPASHSRGYFLIPAAAVLGIAGLAGFIHYNDERRVIPKGQESCSCVNNRNGPVIGGPFTLVDTENRIFTERNLQGNWAVLYFGYTSSPDVGPEQVQVLAKTINILESRHNLKIPPVFVTIDPQRDTPSQLHAYLKEFEPKIIGLTGPVTAIRQMAQDYRVFFKKVEEDGDDYLVESSHNIYLMSPNMEVVRCFGVEYNAEEISEAILKELKPRESQVQS